jgi:hypothetical protein
MIKVKNGLSKIVHIKYDTLKTQEYLKSKNFNSEERNLLYSLRSRSHPSKMNYRKMYSGNLKCSLGCQEDENQGHIFENCKFLKTKEKKINLESIFKDPYTQKEAIKKILRIEKERLKLKEALESPQKDQEDPVV